MEGHKRTGGQPVCPTPKRRLGTPGRSQYSPPPSPSPHHGDDEWDVPLTDQTFPKPVFERESSAEICERLKFDKLPAGGYRRRNPNWESSPDLKQDIMSAHGRNYRREGSPAVSLVSTVLVETEPPVDPFSDASSSDGDSIVSVSSDASSGSTAPPHVAAPLGRKASFVGRLADYARFNKSMVTVFRAKKEEIPTIQRGARRRGVHVAPMPSPPSSSSGSPYASPIKDYDDSGETYVVLGKSKSFVDEVAERGLSKDGSFARPMPGQLTRHGGHTVIERPQITTIPQMIFLMACTSILVVFGLSLLS